MTEKVTGNSIHLSENWKADSRKLALYTHSSAPFFQIQM
jgi:hypothetical protein